MTRPSSSGARRRRPMNLSRGAFRNLAAALSIATLFSATTARAQWTLLTADSTQLGNFTINTWTPSDGISVTSQSGKLITIATRDIVALTALPKGNAAAGQSQARQRQPSIWKLTLRNGDVLFGRAGGFSGQSFLFDTPELGQLAIPLKSVAALTSGAADSASPPPPLPLRRRLRQGHRFSGQRRPPRRHHRGHRRHQAAIGHRRRG